MYVSLDPEHMRKLLKIAEEHKVEPGDLKRLYDKILDANFEQDLYDIISENPDYFEEIKEKSDDNA